MIKALVRVLGLTFLAGLILVVFDRSPSPTVADQIGGTLASISVDLTHSR